MNLFCWELLCRRRIVSVRRQSEHVPKANYQALRHRWLVQIGTLCLGLASHPIVGKYSMAIVCNVSRRAKMVQIWIIPVSLKICNHNDVTTTWNYWQIKRRSVYNNRLLSSSIQYTLFKSNQQCNRQVTHSSTTHQSLWVVTIDYYLLPKKEIDFISTTWSTPTHRNYEHVFRIRCKWDGKWNDW